jgi:transposase-like protein
MKVCPKCRRSARVSERIEADGKKHWLITFCAHCGYNYDIEEYKGKILSPQEEMDKYQGPNYIKPKWSHD